jgi:nicotinate-nucleotide pyrophosphorylase (carboxylating)
LKTQFELDLEQIIKIGLLEDIGSGDHSSIACIPPDSKGKSKLLVKEKGVIAGIDFALALFKQVDSNLIVDVHIPDGTQVDIGDIVFEVYGASLSLLKAERLMLNSMRRMSAIATKTKHFSDLLRGTKTKLLDTRKTTPGIRLLEKWAVRIGGGHNHRFGLYDMIMLKDNHIDFAGGIDNAISKTKDYLKVNQLDLDIIVEVRNFDELSQVLKHSGIRRILIDNFSIENTLKAVSMIDGQCESESSGNINENTIAQYAACGVDYISTGAITHSVQNMDLSFKAF